MWRTWTASESGWLCTAAYDMEQPAPMMRWTFWPGDHSTWYISFDVNFCSAQVHLSSFSTLAFIFILTAPASTALKSASNCSLCHWHCRRMHITEHNTLKMKLFNNYANVLASMDDIQGTEHFEFIWKLCDVIIDWFMLVYPFLIYMLKK